LRIDRNNAAEFRGGPIQSNVAGAPPLIVFRDTTTQLKAKKCTFDIMLNSLHQAETMSLRQAAVAAYTERMLDFSSHINYVLANSQFIV
jgi:hypothetical protein